LTLAPTVVETHVSVLVLLDDVVLKYKKPVRLPFVDLTGVEQRRAACEEEVEVNRRLSPDVYLGVADVVLHGRVLDHAVVMRRLPADRSLAALVAAHAPDLDAHLHRVAAVLADFHARAPRSADIDADAGVDVLWRTWRGCLDTLAGFAGQGVEAGMLARIEDLAGRYLRGRRPLLDDRAAHGRVCDGHGDLLAGDVFLLDDGPRLLDCIEFDPHLRHTDVIADVAFLAMDLERLGAPAAAATFVHLYQEASGDVFPPTLVHHHCAERAVVRAEVACLAGASGARGLDDAHAGAAEALLELAIGHLEEARVVLAVVCGPPGTGKSTVARAVGERRRWPVLRSDEIRRELVDGEAVPGAAVGSDAYAPGTTECTYRTMLARAEVALGLGQPVVLDATFTDPRWRGAAEELARRTSSDLVVMECRAGLGTVVDRVRARRVEGLDLSEADEAVARSLAGATGPWTGAVVLDTDGRPVARSVDAALAALRPERP